MKEKKVKKNKKINLQFSLPSFNTISRAQRLPIKEKKSSLSSHFIFNDPVGAKILIT